jgi:hemerythrin-like metal-binding protein
MAFFQWTDELSIGVELIDSQHKRLIGVINDFYDAVNKGNDETAIRKAVANLTYYVRTHFSDEEKLMEEYNYPQLGLHRRMHERLTQNVHRYAEKFQTGQKILSLDMAIFLKGWLENHIAETDKKIGVFISRQ